MGNASWTKRAALALRSDSSVYAVLFNVSYGY
jgi:hypothetical protein